MLKKFVLTILLTVAGFTAAQEAQAKSCGVELNVTESNADGKPILSAPSTIINLATKKSAKATFFEGYPVFSDLHQGKYKITVSALGYKITVKQIDLNCRAADEDQNSVTINIFLQKGSRNQNYKQANLRRKQITDLAIGKPSKIYK